MTSVLVTGSAGDLGRVVCSLLHNEGWTVVGVDLDPPPDGHVWEQRICDLSDQKAVALLAAQCPTDLGAIIHIAAFQAQVCAQDLALDAWTRSWSVNVASLQQLVATTYPHLIATAPARVLAIGSVHGTKTSHGIAPYSVTKSALAAYVRALAIDGAADGITAVNVGLGAMVGAKLTAGLERWPENKAGMSMLEAVLPVRRVIEPGEVARLVLWLLGPEARHLTGSTLEFDGGASTLLGTEV